MTRAAEQYDSDRVRGGSGLRRYVANKSPFSVAPGLYARTMTRTRHGITYPGLLGAASAGVYLGALPSGLVAITAAAFRAPELLAIVPGGMIAGVWAGPLAALLTRRAIKPRLAHRYLWAVAAGTATMPFYLAVGILPQVLGNEALKWAVGFALICGGAGTVVYYQWRKRLTQHRRVRHQAQPAHTT